MRSNSIGHFDLRKLESPIRRGSLSNRRELAVNLCAGGVVDMLSTGSNFVRSAIGLLKSST